MTINDGVIVYFLVCEIVMWLCRGAVKENCFFENRGFYNLTGQFKNDIIKFDNQILFTK